jgi:hypothetical protein
VSVSQRIFGVFGNGFVELIVLSFFKVGFFSHPDCLDLVNNLPFPLGCGDCLGPLWLFFFLFSFISSVFLFLISNFCGRFLVVVSIFLNLGSSLLLSRFVLFNLNLFTDVFGDVQLDWVVDEFRVLLHKILDLLLLNKF